MDPLGTDHLVVPAEDADRTREFSATARTVAGRRTATAAPLGERKIDLHPAGTGCEPHAGQPVPGSDDAWVHTDRAPSRRRAHLAGHGLPVEHGPADDIGACGPMRSQCVRDPGGASVEIARYEGDAEVPGDEPRTPYYDRWP